MQNIIKITIAAIIMMLLIIGCGSGTTETVEVVVTRVEVVEVEVEGETVEVTRVVTETEVQEVEVTRVVEADNMDPAMAERAKTVIFDIDSGSVLDPELWNPYAAGRRLDHGFVQAVIEPLFILNFESASGEIISWLGESFSSNGDFSEWQLTLRDGVKWSDGEPFNAEDVAFTFQLIQENPDMNGTPNLDGVAVDVVDDLTLSFSLDEPDVRFGMNTFVAQTGSGITILPEHIWNGQDPLTFTNYDPAQGWPVFTGPYTVDAVSENEFTYVRNADWWGAEAGFQELPAPEKLVWVSYGTEETRTAAMAKGDLDSLMNVNLGSFLALKQLNENTIAWEGDLPYAWIDPCARNFDFNHTKEPWNDPEMRMAVNYAIDRGQIIDIAYEGTSTASKTWLPAFAAFNHYVDLAETAGVLDNVHAYDPDQAIAMLESKGYTLNDDGFYALNGEQLDVTVTSFDDGEMNGIASVIVEQLQAIGINAVHDIQQIPDFIGNLTGAGFDTYIFFVCGAVDLWSKMDAFSTRHLPEDPAGEVGGFYSNPWRWDTEAAQAYSDVVAQMQELPPGDPALDDLYVEAMEIWAGEMPNLPISQAVKLVPFDQTYWANWPTTDNPYIQPATWWQSAHVIIHNLEPAQ